MTDAPSVKFRHYGGDKYRVRIKLSSGTRLNYDYNFEGTMYSGHQHRFSVVDLWDDMTLVLLDWPDIPDTHSLIIDNPSGTVLCGKECAFNSLIEWS